MTPEHLTKGSAAPEILSAIGSTPLCGFLHLFFFAKQERAAHLFSLLLSILEVQWDPAILTVLASLGRLARLSPQWGHQDPMNQGRFVDFFT